jgi:HK97 family phage major capsid protein
MPFNSLINRADAAALIPEEVSNALLEEIAGTNPVMALARRLPNMSRAQLRMPVVSALATAYFVQGDTGLKQTTQMAWENRFIDAAEVAAIVPIPESVLADADYDIWGQIQPELIRAFNVAIVEAVLYGTNIPATWTANMGSAGLVAGAQAVAPAPHVASVALFPDIYDAILAESAPGLADGVYGLVETDGYTVTGNVAAIQLRTRLRGYA